MKKPITQILENIGNTSEKCTTGIRVENSCNNIISNNIARENKNTGIIVYNRSKRNVVANNQSIDNNTENHNKTGRTPHRDGNVDRHHSGIILEYHCHSNIINGNICFNTPAGKGHQKYGIAINNRSFSVNDTEASSRNIISSNQCVNNEICGIEDRSNGNLKINDLTENYDG